MGGNPDQQFDQLRPLIFSARRRRVILDADLADLYGVPTKALNQAVRRNASRFPEDFAFQLTELEQVIHNRSHLVTGSQKHRNPSARAWVFTEYGALMAANVLRSAQATQMSLYVIRAFVRLREEQATNAAILKRLAQIDRTLLQHDSALRDVYRKLLPLLQPPPDPPKRGIGFHRGE